MTRAADAVAARATPGAQPCLLADIGGTNARFAWTDQHDAPPRDVQVLPVAAHADLAAAARAYLLRLQGERSARGQPFAAVQQAVFAVAASITGDAVDFTNSPWSFSIAALRQALGLQSLLVINDFEALALALPQLAASQQRALGGPPPQPYAQAPRGTLLAVLGPGTGLGVGAVLRTGQGWQALPAEGGHVTLAAADALQAEVIACVRRSHAHVSAERLLCGPGLPRLQAALATVLGAPQPGPLTPADIVAAAEQGDTLAGRTLDLFIAFLGGFAGNLALTLGARGGVFIGGGLVPRFAKRLEAAGFRGHFEAKGRFAAYLAAVPTLLITDPLAALGGAARAA